MSKIYEKYLPYTDDAELSERIIEWNRVRNGLEFNPALEIRMITEEVCELLEATNLPNMLKEFSDILFVAIGTQAKDRMGYLTDFLDGIMDTTQKLIPMLGESEQKVFGNQYDKVLEVLLAIVTEANENKGFEKDENGKVKKGPNYVNPESTIRQMLEEMRVGY